MFSLKTHNILDYVVGVLLIAAPWIFEMSEVESAKNVFLFAGFSLIIYSLLTDYRYSLAKLIPLKIHLLFDGILGVILLFSPWSSGYRDLITNGQTLVPVVFGLGAIALSIFTKTRSSVISAEVMQDRDRAA